MNEFDEFIVEHFCGGALLSHMRTLTSKAELSPEEALFLVHKCHFVTLEEKHKAYRMLIERYPHHVLRVKESYAEEPLPLGMAMDGGVTLEAYLRWWMFYEDKLEQDFLAVQENEMIFEADSFERYDGFTVSWRNWQVVPYHTLDDCLRSCQSRGSDPTWEPRLYGIDDMRIAFGLSTFKIVKRKFGFNYYITAETNWKGEIVKIYDTRYSHYFYKLQIDLGIEDDKLEPSDGFNQYVQ